MQLTQATDYAFRAMAHLAARPPGKVVNAQTMAEQESIPLRFLLKIMRTLNQAGLITSHRGTEGGFSLARSAESISLLDIVEAMEGRVAIHRCLGEREACNKHCTDECPVHAALAKLQGQLVNGLDRVKLSSLQRPKGTRAAG